MNELAEISLKGAAITPLRRQCTLNSKRKEREPFVCTGFVTKKFLGSGDHMEPECSFTRSDSNRSAIHLASAPVIQIAGYRVLKFPPSDNSMMWLLEQERKTRFRTHTVMVHKWLSRQAGNSIDTCRLLTFVAYMVVQTSWKRD